MLRVLIVDDEPPAHHVLLHHCRSVPDIVVVGRCYSAGEALSFIEAGNVDLMFLDIRMPLFGGLDLLRGLKAAPLTIIVSAYPDHALDGYDLDIVDYLVKPVNADRFTTALAKARRRVPAPPSDVAPAEPFLVLKVDRAQHRFVLDDIEYFEAHGNFVKVRTATGTWLATTTLKNLARNLTGDFVQIHRSFIVNRRKIIEKRAAQVIVESGHAISVGKSYRAAPLLKTADV
jgi:DNA-binding LytR/AlgR family response regulator